MIVQSDDT